ncbi:MAG: Glu/Leu/Phe/Val dehydrogenase [Alphaproteobacteria bacterium]
MAPDVSAKEAIRLARAMTLKNAAAGLAHGGGKSVVFGDPAMPVADKEKLLRGFATAIAELSEYIPGPDMGTDERCMGWVHDEIGRAVGLPREIGGIPLDEVGATGFGLAAAVDVARTYAGIDLKGARVAIQGFGAVGMNAARFLAAMGARLVAASDSRGTIANPAGMDVAALIALKRGGQPISNFGGGEKSASDAIIDVECDIWIPAARPDYIDAGNAPRLKCRIVAEGANIPLTEEAEQILLRRNILVIPDFIANAGGVICAAVELHGGTESSAFGTIDEKIRRNTREVLDEARRTGDAPRVAAVAMAKRRIDSAAATRRWR